MRKRIFTEKFIVRLPDGMREMLKASAEANGRSMNSEVIAALDAWLHQSPVSDLSTSQIHNAEAAALMAAELRHALNRYEERTQVQKTHLWLQLAEHKYTSLQTRR